MDTILISKFIAHYFEIEIHAGRYDLPMAGGSFG